MKALLIIDMQKGCFTPPTNCHDSEGIVERINIISVMFRQRNYPVIFIQHDGTFENELIPQSEEWGLLPELIKNHSDIYLEKTANDSFYQTTLEQLLSERNINELFIVGYATDFCIDATVKSALSKNYKVTVLADCHTTEDKPQLAATTIIDHYNSVWHLMVPTAYKISVLSTDDLMLSWLI